MLSSCYFCLYVSGVRCLVVMFVCRLVLCVVVLLFLFVRQWYALSCYVGLHVSAMRCLLVILVCTLVLYAVFLLCLFVR